MRAYVLTILAAWSALVVGIALTQKPIEKPLLVTAQPASMIVCNPVIVPDAKAQRAKKVWNT